MIKIRNKIFETNSSSSDRYDDDYYDDEPTFGYCPQFLYIHYTVKDGVDADYYAEKVYDKMFDLQLVDARIDKFLEKYFDNYDEWELDDVSDDCIVLKISHIMWYLRNDECDDGFPYTECKDETKKQLLEILHDVGLVEIESIKSMYGSEPDFEDIVDNLW